MISINNDKKKILLQPEVDERKNMFASSLNKQIRHQAIDGELMPHINGWRLGSPISSRIGAPPETRPLCWHILFDNAIFPLNIIH